MPARSHQGQAGGNRVHQDQPPLEFPLHQEVMGGIGAHHDDFLSPGGFDRRKRRASRTHKKGIVGLGVGKTEVHEPGAIRELGNDGQNVQLTRHQPAPDRIPGSRRDLDLQVHGFRHRPDQIHRKPGRPAVFVHERVWGKLHFTADPNHGSFAGPPSRKRGQKDGCNPQNG